MKSTSVMSLKNSRYVRACVLCAASLCVFVGCDLSGPDSIGADLPKRADAPGAVTATAKAQDVYQSSAPIPAKEMRNEVGSIKNSNFEEWEDGMPVAWWGDFRTENPIDDPLVEQTTAAMEGDFAVQINPVLERASVWQAAPLHASIRGQVVTYSAYVRNPVPDGFYFRLGYTRAGELEQVDSKVEQTDFGVWSRFVVETEFPRDADPASARVVFIFRGFGDVPVIVDSVHQHPEDSVPAPEQAEASEEPPAETAEAIPERELLWSDTFMDLIEQGDADAIAAALEGATLSERSLLGKRVADIAHRIHMWSKENRLDLCHELLRHVAQNAPEVGAAIHGIDANMADKAREAIWPDGPYVIAVDYTSDSAPDPEIHWNQQDRDLKMNLEDGALRLAFGESKRDGITQIDLNIPPIPMPDYMAGVRVVCEGDVDPFQLIVDGQMAPGYRLRWQEWYPATRVGDETHLDTGSKHMDLKNRFMFSYFHTIIPQRRQVAGDTTVSQLPARVGHLWLDVAEGGKASLDVKRIELYFPRENEDVQSYFGDTKLFADDNDAVHFGWNPDAPMSDAQLEEFEALAAVGYLGAEMEFPEQTPSVVHDADRAFQGYNFYCIGESPEARLVDMDGNILHTWIPNIPEEWKWEEVGPSWVEKKHWRRAQLLETGEIIVVNSAMLMKLAPNGDIVWLVPGGFHHDIDIAEDGTIYTLTRIPRIIPRYNDESPILEDFITVLTPDGEIIKNVSVLECMEKSEFAPLLDNVYDAGDVFHTNSVTMLTGRLADKSDAFKAGNVMTSLFVQNFIGIVDLEKESMVWGLTGSWICQHDPKVLDNGNLLLFDNRGPRWHPSLPYASRVIELNPFTQEVVWDFKGTRDFYFHSNTCGASDRLPNGNTLISETDSGRAFEVTQEGDIVWEYWNPTRAGENNELISKIQEVIRVPEDFPLDWIEDAAN